MWKVTDRQKKGQKEGRTGRQMDIQNKQTGLALRWIKKEQGKRSRHVKGTWWREINGLLAPRIFEMLFWYILTHLLSCHKIWQYIKQYIKRSLLFLTLWNLKKDCQTVFFSGRKRRKTKRALVTLFWRVSGWVGVLLRLYCILQLCTKSGQSFPHGKNKRLCIKGSLPVSGLLYWNLTSFVHMLNNGYFLRLKMFTVLGPKSYQITFCVSNFCG